MGKINEFKKTLNSIMKSMKSDYPNDFASIIHDRESAVEYRNKLENALNGFLIQNIVDGYDEAIALSPDNMPSIADIARACVSEYTNKPKQAKEPAKNNADAPKEEIIDNDSHPLKLIADAFKYHQEPVGETAEERKARRNGIFNDHEKLINSYKSSGHISGPIFNPDANHNCNRNGCNHAGTRSSGVVGGGQFYCAEDAYRMV